MSLRGPGVIDRNQFPGRQRLKFLIWHFAGCFVVIFALFALNILVIRNVLWFFVPMLGRGGVLAIHTAYVMGLFGGND